MKYKSALVFSLIALSVIGAGNNWQLPSETTKLKPGPGAELVVGNCLLCHSADYISTQPRLTRPAWKATVEKMRAKYGAPIATNKVDELLDYLVTNYGSH